MNETIRKQKIILRTIECLEDLATMDLRVWSDLRMEIAKSEFKEEIVNWFRYILGEKQK